MSIKSKKNQKISKRFRVNGVLNQRGKDKNKNAKLRARKPNQFKKMENY